jgi:hypothetical protein
MREGIAENGYVSETAISEAGGQAGRKGQRRITVGDSVRKLIAAHTRGDSAGFIEAARELVANERVKGHDELARDLERLIDQRDATLFSERRALTPLGRRPADDIPRDKERGLALVEVRQPERQLGELVLEADLLTKLDRVVTENVRGEILRMHGLRPISRMLFCGPPGCGKTVTTEAIATTLGLPLVVVRFDAVVSSYLGETAANLRKIFDFIRGKPYVVLFDEFDAIGKSRSSLEEHGELKRVVSSFLQMLDEYSGQSLLVAATNYDGLLDPALWRRFDEVIVFERPQPKAVKEMLVRGFHQIGLSATVRLDALAKRLQGQSHAAIERVIDDALKTTILRDDPDVSKESIYGAINRQMLRLAPSTPSTTTKKKGQSATPVKKKDQRAAAKSKPTNKARKVGSRKR